MKQENEIKVDNPAKNFCDNYKDDFMSILHVPLVAMCKESNEIIPYEYSDRLLRYRRIEEELDEALMKGGPKRIILYCLKNKISKDHLMNIAGGNLWSYDNMKKNFSYNN